MKREYPQLLHPDSNSLDPSMTAGSSAAGASSRYSLTAPSDNLHEKSKFWEPTEAHPDAGMDELLAVLGYKVRSSDMAQVAQRLEQLEEAMVNVQDGISHLASETVHYNPSDLSTWVETMLSELNPSPNLDRMAMAAPALDDTLLAPAESSTITSIDFTGQNNNLGLNTHQDRLLFEESSSSDYDLKAIPGKALYSQNTKADSTSSRNIKRLKSSFGAGQELFSASSMRGFNVPAESTRSVVLVDSQENGVRLVHTLMACAEAVQQNNINVAQALVKQIGFLAVSQVGAMRKVATYFAEALARRIYRVCPENPIDHSLSNMLQMHFYETCPYLKFAHFTANQAIVEAFEGKKRVHVIDFSINQGMQWPALMQALAVRPGGPPSFRLTGIGPPASDNSDHLQEVGWKLAQFAETIHVQFEYRGFVANSLADLDASMLELRPSEVESVAVNSVFELHKLLARPGALENVLSVVKQIKPEIMTVVEQEAKHNGPVFLDRFTESLHYYSTLFDSLEGTAVNTQDIVMSEVYLGKQICNVVACEGLDRIERHETLVQWRNRLKSSGFAPVHLGSNAFTQASMLLAVFTSGDGYRVEENNGCLMLGWHTRPLIATSAWKLGHNTNTMVAY